MEKGQLAELAVQGAQITVRVTPRASRDRIMPEDGVLRVYVTAPPDGGRANTATQRLLARALGLPKTGLRLVRGQTARQKTFEVL